MHFRYTLSLLGCALIGFGATRRDWLISLVWLGGNFLALGIAYGRGSYRVLGKRSDGTLSRSRRLAFLPFLIFTAAVWHLARLFSREAARNAVAHDLVVGRRLLPAESKEDFDNYVDLTAEFAEPDPIRRSPGYVCFPILDGAAPAPEALRTAVSSLRPGRTYVHCAQGHGRTGLFAVAILLTRGTVGTVEDALQVLQRARPGIRLNSEQLNCARAYAERIGHK